MRILRTNLARGAALGLLLVAGAGSSQAQSPVLAADNETTAYHDALAAYKAANFDEARQSIDAAEKQKPGDPATELLKARILTETGNFTQAENLLKPLLAAKDSVELELAIGDLNLRRHSFDHAEKYYRQVLKAKPDDPDILLKLVYTRVGISDFIAAGQYASHLVPLDPKNPYDAHASYYFAKAAMARATGKDAEADGDIQTARTIYGTTVTNRYLRTYLQLFAVPPSAPNDIPSPLAKPAPDAKP